MPRTLLLSLVAAAFTGCGLTHDSADGGQSGTAIPDMCLEDHRVVVDDPSVAADGFSFAASEAIAVWSGNWNGEADLDNDPEVDGTPVPLSLGVGEALLVVAVYTYLETWGDDTGLAMGEPEVACEPYYEVALPLSLDAAPHLDEDFTPLAKVQASAGGSMHGAIAVDELVGTTRPPFDTARWENNELAVDVMDDEAGLTLSLMWQGFTDDPDSDGDSGTIEPSGESAMLAYVVLTKAE